MAIAKKSLIKGATRTTQGLEGGTDKKSILAARGLTVTRIMAAKAIAAKSLTMAKKAV